MIRSLVGIVCVLVLITNNAQTTAAQFLPVSLDATESVQTSSLSDLIRIADQGTAERILSSAAYHSDLRFRAAPVKQMRNWRMPIVDVRPARLIGPLQQFQPQENGDAITTANQPLPVTQLIFNAITTGATVGSETAADISQGFVSYQNQFEAQVRNQFDALLAIVPQPTEADVTGDSAEDVSTELAANAGRTGTADYWNYYSDCDRWDVVFSIAWLEKSPVDQPAIVDNQNKASTLRRTSRQIFAQVVQQFSVKLAQLGDLSDRYFQIIR